MTGCLEEGRRTERGIREDRDSEWGRAIAVWTWVVPGIVGTIEELFNSLVGGSNIDLINVVNL